MLNKRLMNLVPGCGKFIALNVFLQWAGLLAGISAMFAAAHFFQALYAGVLSRNLILMTAVIMILSAVIRMLCTMGSAEMSYLSSAEVKKTMRRRIFRKMFRLGGNYKEQVQTSEIVQVAVEGTEQLETFFGSYLPQLFYAMAAPLTLFAVLSRISMVSALLLFVCVPLIPVTIMLIQKWAKKLLSRYWDEYAALGDTFLENLQGLPTAKVYQADAAKQQEMNEQAEHFRKITMKVLSMQLNSIAVMDLAAYGGTALGMILAVLQFRAGNVSLLGCLMILLLAAEFFLPMRLLGSYFHIAMNGMAAARKIFSLLDLPEEERGSAPCDVSDGIRISGVSFSYDDSREILHDLNLTVSPGRMTAILGESGSGKSTVAALLTGKYRTYLGGIWYGSEELRNLSESSLYEKVVYVSHQNWLFSGTLRDQLKMGNPHASETEMKEVLMKVGLGCFADRLDMTVEEKGNNFSGGQCQRIALARALLHDADVYIFDEATSNVDAESEDAIMEIIRSLSRSKTVVLITHRLSSAACADRIYVLESGRLAEEGTHAEILPQNGVYARLWEEQQKLEKYAGGITA